MTRFYIKQKQRGEGMCGGDGGGRLYVRNGMEGENGNEREVRGKTKVGGNEEDDVTMNPRSQGVAVRRHTKKWQCVSDLLCTLYTHCTLRTKVMGYSKASAYYINK